MAAYQNENASKTVDFLQIGDFELNKDSAATKTFTFNMGSPAIYGVKTGKYRANLAVSIGGDLASNANCKIRAEVNGDLVLERTYTEAIVNPEFSIPATIEDQVKIYFTTNAAGAEVIDLVGTRFVVLTD